MNRQDKFHMGTWSDEPGAPIEKWECTKCGYVGHNANVIQMEATAGRYGPNGNGFNYWHFDISKENNCGGRMNPIAKATPAKK